MTEADDDDYMSDKFLAVSHRPGVAWGKNAKKYEQEKRVQELNKKNYRRPIKVVEKETREKGLETKLCDDNKGFRMLKKMGYTPGDGLGKTKSGRAEPVPISIKLGRTGLGKDAHEKRKHEVQEKYKSMIMQKRRKFNENLQSSFRARMSGKFMEQQNEKDLRKSQKVCHQLELEDGIESPEFDFFWPRQATADDEEEEEEQEEEYAVEDKLLILTTYLRDSYFYCLWCAVRYNDEEDLVRHCPGATAKDHDD